MFTAFIRVMKDILERHHLCSKNLEKLEQPCLGMQMNENLDYFIEQ
ncbi:hypothetical protein ES319_A07G209700v1 [Gossypium barbadense]|uniref:Uncharacterized protein n=2 Tax=Gossypium TaxID=3633 RepID=A0A5J5V679_GOSBA|nr:hypothetical protein ES319_A07G209700v1 [Gossypium barbadense]KAB2075249.1 hypothetical protein ES319_A07G209700v1 [Gossypium barbadense]TYH11048.1 hypothetical protein ES288_A07G227700v1 [Gossypium darwinii]